MKCYDNHISGIRSYEVHGDACSIAVIFKGGNEVFVFEECKIGKEHLKKMEGMAYVNEGLGRYFSKNKDIRNKFSSMYADTDEYKKLYKPSMH